MAESGKESDSMEKIASFQIHHETLLPGVYVSRVDRWNGTAVTTLDLRLTAPNREPVVDVPALHTIEHLGATFLRSSEWKEYILYFGPMGCRTGCYLLLFGEWTGEQALPIALSMADFIAAYEGDIPGAAPDECGNWLSHDLPMARLTMKRWAETLRREPHTRY